MALKKPSEFFNKKISNQELEINFNENSQKIETVSEAFNSFKNNLNKIDTISDFTETFDNFKDNVEKVSMLSEEIDHIHAYIKNLLKKEDLENAIMSHLIVVEENIQQLQSNVKSLNSKTLTKIKDDFSNLSEKVEEFIDVEVPKYKKLLKDSEIRVEKKINSIDSTVEDKVSHIDQYVQQRIDSIESFVDGINQESLSEFECKIELLSSEMRSLVKNEIPKYKKIIAESKLKNEESINLLNKKIDTELQIQNELLENKISQINEVVNSFINQELPKYGSMIVDTKINFERDLKEYKDNISNEIFSSLEKVKIVKEEIEENNSKKDKFIQEKVEKLESDISSSLDNIESIGDRYRRLFEDFKNREIYNDEKLQSYSESLDDLSQNLKNNDIKVDIEIKKLQYNIEESKTDLNKNIDLINSNLREKIKSLESDIYINEKHIKEQSKGYEKIKEEIYSTIKKLKIDFIEEQNEKISDKINHIEKIFSNFNEKTILNEDGSLLTGVEKEKTKDPLTPLDKKFVTFDDLSTHYRQFINRVQIQLASIGGGGAGFIKDLDDVDFDQTTGDKKLLIYDQANSKWVGIASTALSGLSGVGVGGTWAVGSSGIHTTKNVGIGTTARENFSLYVKGDAFITGNISVAGTVTYDDVTNVDSIGIITARQDVQIGRNLLVTGITTLGSNNGIGTVTIGVGETALYVDGNARIVGVLTVGRSSVTIDGDNNTITAGIVTITNSTIFLGNNITINGSASGINSAPNVIYVAKDGNDLNNGTSIDNAFLTISSAVGVAKTGTIVKVLAGNYLENNPIEVPPFVSIVGDDLKTVTVSPNNAADDIFHVRKGCYIANMTFTNHIAPSAAIGFPTAEIATNVGGGKWESPYIQNCTSNTTTGTGLRIDGAQAEGLKSIVCDSYTQYNQGGVGVAITNLGYAQLVSLFTICCDVGISCHKGAQCSLTNSNTSFGTYGLVADGLSDLQFSGVTTLSASAGQNTIVVAITTNTRPYDGQVVFFDKLYYTVETITVTNGGSGYLTTPSVTISSPDGPNGQSATAFATLNGDSVESITIISSGNQYSSTPSVFISSPDSGVTATASANISPLYYTINSSTPVTAGITTLTIDENLNNSLGIGVTAYFYQVSKISASSHTFEYVGSGNDITTSTPLRGGVPNQENEVIEINGGKVIYTSTDQSGNFRIGNELQINQNTGTISGRAFTRSLFTEMTPFILALS